MLVKLQEAECSLVVDIGEVPGKAGAPLWVPAVVFGRARKSPRRIADSSPSKPRSV
jgi:hypothetical protein